MRTKLKKELREETDKENRGTPYPLSKENQSPRRPPPCCCWWGIRECVVQRQRNGCTAPSPLTGACLSLSQRRQLAKTYCNHLPNSRPTVFQRSRGQCQAKRNTHEARRWAGQECPHRRRWSHSRPFAWCDQCRKEIRLVTRAIWLRYMCSKSYSQRCKKNAAMHLA